MEGTLDFLFKIAIEQGKQSNKCKKRIGHIGTITAGIVLFTMSQGIRKGRYSGRGKKASHRHTQTDTKTQPDYLRRITSTYTFYINSTAKRANKVKTSKPNQPLVKLIPALNYNTNSSLRTKLLIFSTSKHA